MPGDDDPIRPPASSGRAGPDLSNSEGVLNRLLGILTGLSLAASGGAAPKREDVRRATSIEAQALLSAPLQMDAASGRVMKRVAAAYARLRALQSNSAAAGEQSITRMQRPNRFHALQTAGGQRLLAVSVCDGRRYYEYHESDRQYVERDASWLHKVALPSTARLFFEGRKLGQPMLALDGLAAVREYAYHYAGRQKVRGRTADVLRVSTLTRAGGEWYLFQSIRCFDAATSLLVRTVNGSRQVDIQNILNPKFPAAGFVWHPPPGAVKGFG